MRIAVLIMCGVIGLGVIAAMLVSVWSTRKDPERDVGFRQHLAAELVWTSVPILIVVAAAVPAVIAVLSRNSGQ